MANEVSKRSRAWKIARLALFVVPTLGAVGVVLHLRARSYLEGRAARTCSDIEAFESSIVVDRRYPFDKLRGGNAVDDYRELEWLATNPVIWRGAELETPPQSPGRGELFACEPPFSLWGVLLVAALDPKEKTRLDPRKLAQAEAHYARYGDQVIAILRRAVRRTRCDWKYEIRSGVGASLPDFQAASSAGGIMRYRAARSSPEKAIELSLELIAVGQDYARHPAYGGAMIGLFLRYHGFKSLERALQYKHEAEAYRRVLTRLDLIGPPPAYDRRADVLALNVTMSKDHSAMIEFTPEGLKGGREFNRFQIPIVMEGEWRALDAMRERIASWDGLPLDELRARHEALKAELASSWWTFAPLSLENIPEKRDQYLEAEVHHGLGRLTVAAYLYRIEEGRWPAAPRDLASYLGEVPKDPYSADRQFCFEEEDGGWRLSSGRPSPPISLLARRS